MRFNYFLKKFLSLFDLVSYKFNYNYFYMILKKTFTLNNNNTFTLFFHVKCLLIKIENIIDFFSIRAVLGHVLMHPYA